MMSGQNLHPRGTLYASQSNSRVLPDLPRVARWSPPVEAVVKRIATLEEESGGVLKVASISEASGKVNPAGADKQVSEIEEMVNQ